MSLVLVVAVSLTGFLTYSMPAHYYWIQESNILRYALLGMLLSEFEGLTFVAPDGSVLYGIEALPARLLLPLILIMTIVFTLLILIPLSSIDHSYNKSISFFILLRKSIFSIIFFLYFYFYLLKSET